MENDYIFEDVFEITLTGHIVEGVVYFYIFGMEMLEVLV